MGRGSECDRACQLRGNSDHVNCSHSEALWKSGEWHCCGSRLRNLPCGPGYHAPLPRQRRARSTIVRPELVFTYVFVKESI